MRRDSPLKLALLLIVSIGLSMIGAFWLRSLFYYPLGPLFIIASFLLLPIALTIVVDEWWTLVLTPFLFWSLAWSSLYLLDHLTFGDEQQLIATIVFFTVASLISGTLGILIRRYISYLKRR
jgi:hypothetical protein